MASGKHLTLDQRLQIQEALKTRSSFRAIAQCLDKDPSTISKEIRTRLVKIRKGPVRGNFNACKYRFTCQNSHICSSCHSGRKYTFCRNCGMCNRFCRDFTEQICNKLLKPPYVCNGCGKRYECSLEKRFYEARTADDEYRAVLKETRAGIALTESEIEYLDSVISPLIRQNQSPHHICATNRDTLMVSERSIYRYIDGRILSAMNMELPRKIRYSARKKTVHVKVDKKCRNGRTYEDLQSYLSGHPDIPIVELDSVEGNKGGKVLLTVHFKKAEMMLAFIRDHNDSKSVIDIFNRLYKDLGPERFRKIFPLCVCDNGSEFSNPAAIEFDPEGNKRTMIFYCDPNAPYQKGSAERNHEFIRECIPKGKSMDPYTQEDISLMMDHINSYVRLSLGDKTPYEMFEFLYGEEILHLLKCHKISASEVTMKSSIFQRRKNNENN